MENYIGEQKDIDETWANKPMDKRKEGVSISWIGYGIAFIGNIVIQFSLLFGLVITTVGMVVILKGTHTWATGKGRKWVFMFWGLLAPIGFLGISLLKDKRK